MLYRCESQQKSRTIKHTRTGYDRNKKSDEQNVIFQTSIITTFIVNIFLYWYGNFNLGTWWTWQLVWGANGSQPTRTTTDRQDFYKKYSLLWLRWWRRKVVFIFNRFHKHSRRQRWKLINIQGSTREQLFTIHILRVIHSLLRISHCVLMIE